MTEQIKLYGLFMLNKDGTERPASPFPYAVPVPEEVFRHWAWGHQWACEQLGADWRKRYRLRRLTLAETQAHIRRKARAEMTAETKFVVAEHQGKLHIVGVCIMAFSMWLIYVVISRIGWFHVTAFGLALGLYAFGVWLAAPYCRTRSKVKQAFADRNIKTVYVTQDVQEPGVPERVEIVTFYNRKDHQ